MTRTEPSGATGKPGIPSLDTILRPDLDPAALYGLPGEVATALAAETEADPAALLLVFLTMFGNAAGPQPHVWFGRAAQPARLFLLLVGKAAKGRKGTAYEALEPIFQQADPEWALRQTTAGLQSAEALIDLVADDKSDDCRLLVVETEFGRLIGTMVRSGTLTAQLKNAWDGRKLQANRRDRKRSQTASHAHISLIGMITPDEMLHHQQRLRMGSGGLESRLLYIYSAPSQGNVDPFEPGTAAQADLADRVALALVRSRESVMTRTDPISSHLLTDRGIQPHMELRVSEEVRKRWAEVKAALPVTDDDLGGFFDRAQTHVIRLAAAYAITECATEVSMAHIEAAVALWRYCARSAEVIIGIPVGQVAPRINPSHRAKILKHLYDRYPGWAAKDEIGTGLFRKNVPAADIEAVLADLEDKGLVERRTVPTRGRPREECRLLPPDPDFSRNPVPTPEGG